ncbi:MAG: hypothetical protein WC143_08305 [Eubacteriales bacterium]|jgi:hypothetical protein
MIENLKNYKPIKIESSAGIINQTFSFENRVWFVSRLIEMAKDLPVFDMPMQCLNIYNLQPDIDTMLKFVTHMHQVYNADLNYPIILDEDGYVMDGRHRIAKALFLGLKSIRAVRFEQTPLPDKYIES